MNNDTRIIFSKLYQLGEVNNVSKLKKLIEVIRPYIYQKKISPRFIGDRALDMIIGDKLKLLFWKELSFLELVPNPERKYRHNPYKTKMNPTDQIIIKHTNTSKFDPNIKIKVDFNNLNCELDGDILHTK
ncbi:hypothetical protein [Echinicola vietnamensis]|uniref:Uncharacterized protein n=1 Tax=Echinicola vietnamensis (strain DSM 17526 / LMG 23754 / KMM 6221) TaxID=926556 RepID=L0FVC9_ECHVK|nr:hypothetical protein [Echinicola vietnamensis]AGA76711.1 hypothetical protein Echvi_0425 [Echinicola vietnamensis DSM 17526]